MNQTTSIYSIKTQEYIASLSDENYCIEDVVEFIEEYGEETFLSSYEEYVRCGEAIGYEAVDALMKYDPELIWNCDENYQGCYNSLGDFAEEFVTSVMCESIPECVVVDWESTWNSSLRYDFSDYTLDGYVYIFRDV